MRGPSALVSVTLCGGFLLESSTAFRPVSSHVPKTIQPLTHALVDPNLHALSSADTSELNFSSWSQSVVIRSSALVGGVAIAGSVLPSVSFASINSFFKYYPLIASFLICAFKASSADFFAQFMSFKTSPVPRQNSDTMASTPRRKMPYSVKRNIALLCYGGLYQGCAQSLIYNNMFSALFGVGTHHRTVLMKVCFDMLIIQPILSLPIAYIIKAPIFGHSFSDSIRRYVQDVKYKKLLHKCWLVWAPAQIVSFTIIPPHLRISFMACVSFFWIILFSTMTSSSASSQTGNSITGSKRI